MSVSSVIRSRCSGPPREPAYSGGPVVVGMPPPSRPAALCPPHTPSGALLPLPPSPCPSPLCSYRIALHTWPHPSTAHAARTPIERILFSLSLHTPIADA
eukprot:scaffold62496_cov26-Tisochrysis_lutea.AAC.1